MMDYQLRALPLAAGRTPSSQAPQNNAQQQQVDGRRASSHFASSLSSPMVFTAARPFAGIGVAMTMMTAAAAFVMFIVKQLPKTWASWSAREMRETSAILARRRWMMRAGGDDASMRNERDQEEEEEEQADETEREMRARLRAEGIERRRGARDALRMRILQREVKALRAEVQTLRHDVAASVALVERQMRIIEERTLS